MWRDLLQWTHGVYACTSMNVYCIIDNVYILPGFKTYGLAPPTFSPKRLTIKKTTIKQLNFANNERDIIRN